MVARPISDKELMRNLGGHFPKLPYRLKECSFTIETTFIVAPFEERFGFLNVSATKLRVRMREGKIISTKEIE